jgi:hypothetical protein
MNRPSTLQIWQSTRTAPAERLAKFRSWLADEVENRIQWPGAPDARVKQVHQAARFIETFVLELSRRGWLFDGPHLAKHIRAQLDEIRAAQVAGRVNHIWPFFKSVIDRYAGVKAEELAAEALSLKCHLKNIERDLSLDSSVTLPELVAIDARLRAEASLRKSKTPKQSIKSIASIKSIPTQSTLL